MFPRFFNRSAARNRDRRVTRRSIDCAARSVIETLEDRQLYSASVHASLAPPLPAPVDNGGTLALSSDPDADITGANFLGSAGARSKFTVNGTIGGADSDDYYRLDMTAPATVKVKLGKLKEDASLELVDSNGNTITESDNPDNTGEVIIQTVNPGTYYLHVASEQDGTGTGYRMTVATKKARGTPYQAPVVNPAPAPSPTPTPVPSEDIVFTGELTSSDPQFSDGTSFDKYAFTAAADGNATITLGADAYVPYLQVDTASADGSTSPVVFDSNAANGPTASVQFAVTAGTQYVVHAGQVVSGTGEYTMTCSPECAGIAPVASNVTPAPAPQEVTVHGTLQQGDQTLNSGAFYDQYAFSPTVSGSATIAMTSSDLTPQLAVVEQAADGSYQAVAVDKNTDGDGNATASFDVVAGHKYILATTSAGPATGGYDLVFSQGVGIVTDDQGNVVGGDTTTVTPAPAPAPQSNDVGQVIAGRQWSQTIPNSTNLVIYAFAPDGTGWIGAGSATGAFANTPGAQINWQSDGANHVTLSVPGGTKTITITLDYDPTTGTIQANDGVSTVTWSDDGSYQPWSPPTTSNNSNGGTWTKR